LYFRLSHEQTIASLVAGILVVFLLPATPEQFRRAYPQATQFFEFKRQHDPQELFQNLFYLKYGKP
jgi:hypothetical protein